MRKIYYKEGEHIRNKVDYIVNFINREKKVEGYPATYYRDNDFMQCRGVTGRSFKDLFWLFKSKFKTATKGELARILLNKRYSFISIYYCDSINKLVVTYKSLIDSFINNEHSIFSNDPVHIGMYMNESYVKEGPNFDELLRYALRSKKFSLGDINLNPIKDYEKDLL